MSPKTYRLLRVLKSGVAVSVIAGGVVGIAAVIVCRLWSSLNGMFLDGKYGELPLVPIVPAAVLLGFSLSFLAVLFMLVKVLVGKGPREFRRDDVPAVRFQREPEVES